MKSLLLAEVLLFVFSVGVIFSFQFSFLYIDNMRFSGFELNFRCCGDA